PCAGWQGYTLGNVNKKKLKDIWVNSEKLNYLRKINKSQFPQCLECESIDYCSLCFVRNFNENNGDMFKVNEHFCSVAKLNRELAESYKSELSL
ncbi:MAG: SPASM domain-containing protein, partial [Bacteroidetes bacterium]|nr:SPASM domain-containing protein [Bacteroidota bacterium]MBU1421774.1 SPASM domain-containing protein [Bacteroidota bacterium]